MRKRTWSRLGVSALAGGALIVLPHHTSRSHHQMRLEPAGPSESSSEMKDELFALKRASRTRPSPVPKSSSTPLNRTKHRKHHHVHIVVKSASGDFAHSRRGIGIANCESGPGPHAPKYDVYVGNIHARTGKYGGKWMIGPSEWRDWGGLKFASRPELASEAAQDQVADNGYAARGVQPWSCSHMV